MRRVILTVLLLLALATPVGLCNAQAATPAQIEQAVSKGVAWLAGQQNSDGSWGAGQDLTAKTCFVLIKLEERARDLGYLSPFDPSYPYSDEIAKGWHYVFNAARVSQTPLTLQDHTMLPGSGTMDNPDTNGNGYGLYFYNDTDTVSGSKHYTYATGICLMALAASRTPGRANDGGLDFNGNGTADTFQEIAQEAVDWLAFAQGDFNRPGFPDPEGGWSYDAQNNTVSWSESDQSNSGYAVLALAYGEAFGCTVPGWVKTELNVWINNIQCADGGSGYAGCSVSEVSNELRTGNLIFEMTFYGDNPSVPRFQNALGYIEAHWRDPNINPGWGYNVSPAEYQAMYCLMKGLQYSNVDLIDTDGDHARDDNWFNQDPPASPAQDFASVLVAQQNADGSWTGNCNHGDPILCTVWALLTLEKVAPPKAPTTAKAFNPTTAFVGQSSTATFTITNTNSTLSLTGIAFTDNLPSNLVVANPPNVVNTCGGTVTAVANGGTISLSGGTLAPNGSCTINVNVASAAAGVYNNTTGPVSATESGAGNPSNTATLTVKTRPVGVVLVPVSQVEVLAPFLGLAALLVAAMAVAVVVVRRRRV